MEELDKNQTTEPSSQSESASVSNDTEPLAEETELAPEDVAPDVESDVVSELIEAGEGDSEPMTDPESPGTMDDLMGL